MVIKIGDLSVVLAGQALLSVLWSTYPRHRWRSSIYPKTRRSRSAELLRLYVILQQTSSIGRRIEDR